MKFSAVLAVVAAAAISAGAVPAETNADRFARGLPPLPPVRRATPVGAKRSSPSGSPGHCNTGSPLCCGTLTKGNNSLAKTIIGLLGLIVGPDVDVGLTCAPLIIPLPTLCAKQIVCCDNNYNAGLLAVGCSPLQL